MLEQRREDAESLQQHLSEHVGGRPRYEVLKVLWFRDGGGMVLLIRKKGGKQLEPGATLSAIDVEDGKLMAELEVVEVRAEGYYARVSGRVDRVWFSEVLDRDQPELPPPPSVWAFVRLRRGGV